MSAYDEVKDFVEHKYNRSNGYATVSLARIFQGLFSSSTPGEVGGGDGGGERRGHVGQKTSQTAETRTRWGIRG